MRRVGPSVGGQRLDAQQVRTGRQSDLWGKLIDLCEAHEVEFRWVRGHAGDVENERCDQLAVQAVYPEGSRYGRRL